MPPAPAPRAALATAPARTLVLSLAALATTTALAANPAFAPRTHLLNGTLEAPVFANSLVGTDLLWDAGYFGLGIIIANVEAGHVWSGHEVFDRAAIATALGIPFPASPALLVNAPATIHAPELGEVDFHATMVGHVLVGAGTVVNGGGSLSLTQVGAGIAPFASLWSGAIASRFDKTAANVGSFEITPESFTLPYVEFFTGATHGRADVINSSWGDSAAAANALETRIITGLAAANPQVAAVFSAGNSGPGLNTVGGPGASFNVITVGSVGGADQLTPSDFSSGGPGDFFNPATSQFIAAARTAVHIAAPGENFALAAYLQPTGGLEPLLTPELITPAADLYFLFSSSGTSFSAPTVAGGIALLKDFIKTGPFDLPQTQALDTRVIRSVIMASAVPTTGWDNAQAPTGPGGSLLTTQALDYSAGAGRFDVGRSALLYIVGTADVPGLSGATDLAPSGWDYAALSFGEVNDYTLDLTGATTPLELTVSLNWFVSDYFDTLTRTASYGSFANLDLEVWQLNALGGFQTLLAASRSSFNTSEFLRFILPSGGASLGLSVVYDGLVYNFDGPAGEEVTYGLAWSTTPIPEPASVTAWTALLALATLFTRRRRN